MESGKKLKCNKCNVELVEMNTSFSYLDRSFNHSVPRCPKCGQVYIDEDLARGQIKKVETSLEDK